MNQLQVINVKKGIIKTNFEEFHKALKLQVQGYKNLVVTEDNLKDMKKSRLELTKSIKIIDDERKKQKKEFIEPLTEYEGLCRQAIQTIEEAETELKTKIDFFDEKVRKEKLDHAQKFAQEKVKESELNQKYIDRLDVDKSEFTNVTTTKKAIERDIQEQLFFLTQAQDREENNKAFVNSQLDSSSKLANLSTPLILDDIRHLIDSYETMDTSKVGQGITEIALRRKEAEELAVKREAERLKEKAEKEAREAEQKRQREELEKQQAIERAEIKHKQETQNISPIFEIEEVDVLELDNAFELDDEPNMFADTIEIESITFTGRAELISQLKEYALSIGLTESN